MDLSDMEDVQLLAGQIQSFVKRKLPIRFGIVPLTKNSGAIEQAKVMYHLLDSYGLAAALAYLEDLLVAKKTVSASKTSFEAAVKHRSLRQDGIAISLEQVLDADEYQERIQGLKKWLSRLSAGTSIPPFFINGIAYPRNENWLQLMSNRVNMDLQTVQRAVFEETIAPDAWVPNHFLSKALSRRNTLVIPENEGSLKIFDINKIYAEHQDVLTRLPTLPTETSESVGLWTHMVLIADLGTNHGQQLLSTAARFRESNPGIELVIVHNSRYPEGLVELVKYMKTRAFEPLDSLDDLTKLQDDGPILMGKVDETEEVRQEALQFWTASKALVEAVGLQVGEQGILINGRLVGPIPHETEFFVEDFVQLLEYERTKRIIPAYIALQDLGLADKVVGPLAGAKVTSIIALSTISDVPEGIFEQAPTLRISTFDVWKSEHTAIEVGDAVTADISITAVVDPASEPAQRWIPILRVLSELEGVHLKLYLNPREKLQELPVKRFYRYVLDSKPKFNNDGSLRSPGASFGGIPKEALLTVGMDVPPPWLVAPKVSVHDLDNIKLSNTKADVDAVYELENILIEGHSREIPGAGAPRGAQLVLRTERDPHFADTIIMANLGYFQFKANPGYYKIDLQAGRSSEIFKIDSVGPYGWNPVPGDEKTDVALMSFQGATLYPRLSRNPGQEEEDVLEVKTNSTKDYVSQGLKFAENLLGFGKGKKGEVIKSEQHAEINIFSVASGHLYERMLNIMMVSVMKHTRHTVKFWFIEQFLSPSFKDFIPFLAAEYGFQYEMVTYKWPHWLRAQSEKQREIWGYKILFLDVLFPLSLDKVIFVDADQIVRTDMIELVNHDLNGAPYGFTPMCDSRTEMEGFRFWKQGYWKGYLKGLPYHISALYVVDLHRFRQIAAGDRLRQQYHQLSADPGSLANLDQDLPNHMQMVLPIHSLPQEWLWCETWCSDESLKDAKTIDLCNNPLTKEPKLDRARRQVPEWTMYDDEIAAVDRRRKGMGNDGTTTVLEPERNTKSRIHEETPSSSHVVDEL
jgi:UDP-glucose:glycoprotein glucosyltransferase